MNIFILQVFVTTILKACKKNPVLLNAGPTVGEGGCRPFRRSRSHLEEGNPAIRDGRGLEHVFLMLSDVCFTHINNSCIGSVCCLILDISYAERSYGTHQSPINCNLNTNFFFKIGNCFNFSIFILIYSEENELPV